MNIYIVVEGSTEKLVYASWIPLVNPLLKQVNYLPDVISNNFLIISGRGYPNYFEIIDNAIDEINEIGIFDRLVICVDSEDFTYQEKYDEILNHLHSRNCSVEVRVIVQHFCIEAWALGNRRIVRKEPRTHELRSYKKFYNVRDHDPELLPPLSQDGLNKAQTAEKYLRVAFRDRYKNLAYSKGTPYLISYYKYFDQVKKRFFETSHIRSFAEFLRAFSYEESF